MAIQFPNNPTLGQSLENTSSGLIYTWNGVSWDTNPVTSSLAYTSSYAITASLATTASFAQSASLATTASFAQSASLAEKSKFYFLQAYSTASYTLPGGYTPDPCRYNVVDVADNVPAAWFNTSTYRFTPQKAGYWEITATYDVYRGGSSVEGTIQILKNFFIFSQAGTLGAVQLITTRTIYLNGTTDYIQVNNIGASANARTQDAGKAYFQARWVGE